MYNGRQNPLSTHHDLFVLILAILNGFQCGCNGYWMGLQNMKSEWSDGRPGGVQFSVIVMLFTQVFVEY